MFWLEIYNFLNNLHVLVSGCVWLNSLASALALGQIDGNFPFRLKVEGDATSSGFRLGYVKGLAAA